MHGNSAQLILSSLAALAVTTVYAQPPDIVLQDPVRIAFYEPAQGSLELSMREAVERRCEVRVGSFGEASETMTSQVPWYCSSTELRYFRAVDVLGNEYKTGLACDADDVTPNLRYYTEDMFANGVQCVFVAYDTRTALHSIDQ